jgi:F-type H+-transporting ATPase subunit epsilon
MADKVKFELVSPEKVLVAEEVDMVVVPGEEGNFGVLPNHAPVIAALRPGTIDIYDNDTVAERIFVAAGFVEVTPTRCTVLADEATRLVSIDRADAEAELAKWTAEVATLRGGPAEAADIAAGEKALAVATARINALALIAH